MSQATPTDTFRDNDFCFACGGKNPLGLHLCFEPYAWPDGAAGLCCRLTPQPHWQGWENVMHGGIQATILDDLMSNHLFKLERAWAVTAGISLRYIAPVPLDQPLLCLSRVERRSGKLWELASRIVPAASPLATPLTEASGRFIELAKPT